MSVNLIDLLPHKPAPQPEPLTKNEVVTALGYTPASSIQGTAIENPEVLLALVYSGLM